MAPDPIIRYSRRQMRRFIMSGLAVMRPDAVRQLIHQTDALPTNEFRQLVDSLIRRYCSRFVERLQKWERHCNRTHDPLYCMIHYHQIWEGFPSSEPWFDSASKPITYFLDTNYDRRLREMDQVFYRHFQRQ